MNQSALCSSGCTDQSACQCGAGQSDAIQRNVAEAFEPQPLRPSDYALMKRHKPRHTVNVEKSPILVANPSYATPAYDLVSFCEEERDFDEAVQLLKNNTYPKTFVAAADGFVSLMVDNDFLAMNIYVDGEPYEGTFDDLVEDESIPVEAEVTYGVRATDLGRETVAPYAPTTQLAKLIESDEEAAPVHLRVLELCSAEGGCSKQELDRTLNAEGLIPHDERTGLISIYPAYYIDNLEKAGGLVWKNTWLATDEGREVLANTR
ncbi:hypothetical protein PZH32_05430 [Adlercreutzia equolifaciens]|uniref:hypothetical protein n=1 Tax=Adlercreutzia equolifaciens TaxID=446660 RepID=UPI0023AF3F91|nr:hypothetical protein [Adlercreutzia equolifaciens]MDE8702405.1 hypothetical protein [Adlercreutzia equolifaciens]